VTIGLLVLGPRWVSPDARLVIAARALRTFGYGCTSVLLAQMLVEDGDSPSRIGILLAVADRPGTLLRDDRGHPLPRPVRPGGVVATLPTRNPGGGHIAQRGPGPPSSRPPEAVTGRSPPSREG
jgi:hypothetical protein